jgi:hypothetical protein
MELATLLVRRAVEAPAHDRARCSTCRRTPLTGELLHVGESGEATCALCLELTPQERREPTRAVRVHAAERPLAVVSRAA